MYNTVTAREDPVMKIERLSQDKIRIFLTYDDLTERGIKKEDMWREIPKVHELFSEMMDQAYNELGFDATGPLAVEVFTLPAQGMVVIVTKGSADDVDDDQDPDLMHEEALYEMEVTLEQSDVVQFAFSDFEHLLSAAKRVNNLLVDGGSLYKYKDRWILQLDIVEVEEQRFQNLIALLSEYGEAAAVSEAVLEEYGTTVIADDAIKVLCSYF